jgi:hypothetical protein
MNAVLGAATSEVVVSQGSSITDRVAMLLASVDKTMMIDAFRRMNADENGIELRELHAFLAEIDESVTEADARSVISAGGPSGDGKVSLAELLKIKAREDGTSLDLSPDERSWSRRPSVQGRVPPLRMSPRVSVPPSASASSVWSPFGWNRPASSGRDAYEKSARTPGSDGQKSVGRSQRSAPPLPLVIEKAAAEKAERAAAEKVAAEAEAKAAAEKEAAAQTAGKAATEKAATEKAAAEKAAAEKAAAERSAAFKNLRAASE